MTKDEMKYLLLQHKELHEAYYKTEWDICNHRPEIQRVAREHLVDAAKNSKWSTRDEVVHWLVHEEYPILKVCQPSWENSTHYYRTAGSIAREAGFKGKKQ